MKNERNAHMQLNGAAPEPRTHKKVKQRIWMAWEKGMEWMMDLRSEHTLEFGICKVLVKKYSGPAILCKDGTWIQEGDRIGELHLNNRMVLDLTREVGADRAAIRTARQVRDSLKAISESLDSKEEMSGVRALVGVTLLHRGFTHGLGFEERSLPSRRFEMLTTFYLRLLLRFMHPEGVGRVNRSKEKLTPLMLVYSRTALIQKFEGKSQLRWCRSSSDPVSAAPAVSL